MRNAVNDWIVPAHAISEIECVPADPAVWLLFAAPDRKRLAAALRVLSAKFETRAASPKPRAFGSRDWTELPGS